MRRLDEIIEKNSPLILKEFRPMIWDAPKIGYHFWICWRYIGTEKWRSVALVDITEDEKYFWRPSRKWALLASTRYIDKIRDRQLREIQRVTYGQRDGTNW